MRIIIKEGPAATELEIDKLVFERAADWEKLVSDLLISKIRAVREIAHLHDIGALDAKNIEKPRHPPCDRLPIPHEEIQRFEDDGGPAL